MNKKINFLDVEIAGINARISAIQKLKSKNKLPDKEILTKLELMLMVDGINEAILIADGRKILSRLMDE